MLCYGRLTGIRTALQWLSAHFHCYTYKNFLSFDYFDVVMILNFTDIIVKEKSFQIEKHLKSSGSPCTALSYKKVLTLQIDRPDLSCTCEPEKNMIKTASAEINSDRICLYSQHFSIRFQPALCCLIRRSSLKYRRFL